MTSKISKQVKTQRFTWKTPYGKKTHGPTSKNSTIQIKSTRGGRQQVRRDSKSLNHSLKYVDLVPANLHYQLSNPSWTFSVLDWASEQPWDGVADISYLFTHLQQTLGGSGQPTPWYQWELLLLSRRGMVRHGPLRPRRHLPQPDEAAEIVANSAYEDWSATNQKLIAYFSSMAKDFMHRWRQAPSRAACMEHHRESFPL